LKITSNGLLRIWIINNAVKKKRREFLKSIAVGTADLAFGISGVYIDKKGVRYACDDPRRNSRAVGIGV